MPPAVDSPGGKYLGRGPLYCRLLPCPGGVDRRSHLLEQFLAGVRLRDEPFEPLGEHVPELALLGEATAQHDRHVRVQAAELVEDRIAIHYREEEIQDDQGNLLADLLVNLEGFKAVL